MAWHGMALIALKKTLSWDGRVFTSVACPRCRAKRCGRLPGPAAAVPPRPSRPRCTRSWPGPTLQRELLLLRQPVSCGPRRPFPASRGSSPARAAPFVSAVAQHRPTGAFDVLPVLRSSGSGSWCRENGQRQEGNALGRDFWPRGAARAHQFAGDPGWNRADRTAAVLATVPSTSPPGHRSRPAGCMVESPVPKPARVIRPTKTPFIGAASRTRYRVGAPYRYPAPREGKRP